MLLELIYGPIKLFTCVGLEEVLKSSEAILPNTSLCVIVVNNRDRIVRNLVVKCCMSNLCSSLSVCFIIETWMISVLYTISCSKDPLTNVIEIL
jgi:hypothetical protein